MHSRRILSLAVVAVLAGPTLAMAEYSPAVKQACKNDYKRFCGQFAPQDPGLRPCMDKAGKRLTRTCVDALIDAGEITKERATQRWKQQ